MKSQSAGTPRAMRNLNESLLLDMIISGGPKSRAELSRQIGLSKPTVSSAITHLIERGLVIETGRGDNSQGRKATLLEFNTKCFYTIGVDVGATRIRMALADMGGQICLYRQLEMPLVNMAGHEFQAFLEQSIGDLLGESGAGWETITAIAFGIPGIVDPASGEVFQLVAPLKGLEDTLKLTNLARLFPVPVLTENDVNLAALAEHSLSGDTGRGTFFYFSIGEGTGGGIIIDGKIFRGLGGAAGELANMKLGGERLEEVLSAGGLLRLAARMASEYPGDPPDGVEACVSQTELLFEEVRRGHPLALSVMEDYCSRLAEALTNISAVIAPDTIVLGGGIGGNGDLLLHRLEPRISGLNRPPCLSVSGHAEKDVVLGAIQIAIQAAFQHIREEQTI